MSGERNLVDVGPGGGESGERRCGEAGGQRAAQQVAALHRIIFSMVGLRAENGGVLPGLRSKSQEGTGNAQPAGDSLDNRQGGDSCGAPGDLTDALGLERAGFGDPVVGDPRFVCHGEHCGEVPLAQRAHEGRVGQQTVRELGW
ncbi:hypothetical protein [Streptomyces sp. KM273126]|uniref:hypothetical protein n=1 Tax=Streptomyces sp. KM273126 TaxID=2545247 RepID=UPI001C66D2A9|nr:hypothetical protein [Streptomyces sp. KM273126]